MKFTEDELRVIIWALELEERAFKARIEEASKSDVLLEGSVQRVSPVLTDHLKLVESALKKMRNG